MRRKSFREWIKYYKKIREPYKLWYFVHGEKSQGIKPEKKFLTVEINLPFRDNLQTVEEYGERCLAEENFIKNDPEKRKLDPYYRRYARQVAEKLSELIRWDGDVFREFLSFVDDERYEQFMKDVEKARKISEFKELEFKNPEQLMPGYLQREFERRVKVSNER